MIIGVAGTSLIMSCIIVPSAWFGDFYPWFVERFGGIFPNWLRRLIIVKSQVNASGVATNKVEVET
jgi:hypothetical protein